MSAFSRAAHAAGKEAIGALAASAGRRVPRRGRADEPEPAHALAGPAPKPTRRLWVPTGDGGALAVQVHGPPTLPTVVLVHGWTSDNDAWRLQVAGLAGHARVVTYDQRDHGDSRSPLADAGPGTAAILADDLAAVLDAVLAQGQRALLVGHSMGGMTIMAWADHHRAQVPRLASGAVLCSTAAGNLMASSRTLPGAGLLGEAVESLATQVVSVPLRLPGANPVTRRLFGTLGLGPGATREEAAFCEAMIIRCPTRGRRRWGLALPSFDFTGALAHLTVPTTVVVGARDRLIPPRHARYLAEHLPDLVALVEVDDAGHMVPFEAPETLNQLLLDHLYGLAETG